MPGGVPIYIELVLSRRGRCSDPPRILFFYKTASILRRGLWRLSLLRPCRYRSYYAVI